jgi:hypothetical protein
MSPGQRRNMELLLSALGTVEPARRSTRRWNGWRGSKVASVENSVAVITRAQATGSCRQLPSHTATSCNDGSPTSDIPNARLARQRSGDRRHGFNPP